MLHNVLLYNALVLFLTSILCGCSNTNAANELSVNQLDGSNQSREVSKSDNALVSVDDKNSAKSNTTNQIKQRKFKFVYAATISQLKPGARAKIWIPVATSSVDQIISGMKVSQPSNYQITTEKKYGNKVLYFQGTANDEGQIPIYIEYQVLRKENTPSLVDEVKKSEKKLFLMSNSKVPVNGLLSNRIFSNSKPMGNSLAVSRKVYDAIFNRMTYNKPNGKPWGQGDALWACDSKYGNCTDFHSLFIAVNRDLKIPAKFEIGFPIPNDQASGKVGGYHCWAKFASGGQWQGVDISEAAKLKGKPNEKMMREYYFTNLSVDRVHFTTGRDLQLLPKPTAGEVNFLAYPYVEVDGKPHTKLIKQFSYENIK